MLTTHTLALVCMFASLALAQRNVTVQNTDPSITYQGHNIGDSAVCRYESGSVVAGQPGCYNFGRELCTESVTMGRRNDSSATLTFKGSAIFINSALNNLSPLYTVTLDGQAEDVDGFRESRAYTCQSLFSRTGLDPDVDHTITLASKGQSPQDTNSTNDAGSNFSLIDFTFTIEDSNDTTSSNPETNGSSTAGPGASTSSETAASPTEDSEGTAVALSTPLYGVLGSVLALTQVLL